MKPIKSPKRKKLLERLKANKSKLDRPMLLPIGLLVLGLVLGTGLGMLAGINLLTAPSSNGAMRGVSADDTPYRSGPFRFGVAVSPEKPVIGRNTLRITLGNLEGEPVSGASLKAVAEMPAMGAMSAMQAPADMEEVAPGKYEGRFELSMDRNLRCY